MNMFKKLLAAAVLATASIAVAAPVAAAQGTKVVVIDQARVMRESLGGKDIQAKLQGIEDAIAREMKPTADSLTSEGKAIEAKSANMTDEAIRADTALQAEVQAYVAKAQQFNQRRQVASQEIQLTERKAWSDFFRALQPVLQEVVTETGAQVMMDRSDLIFADPAIDSTALVISKLDARSPTMVVTRQTAPTQPQQ